MGKINWGATASIGLPLISTIVHGLAGKSAQSKPGSGGGGVDPALIDKADPDSFKKGGLVKKTGYAKVHKGERVLTKAQQKRHGNKRGNKRK